MSAPIEIIAILAAICYVMARRLIGEPAQGKRMLLLPAILVVVGLSKVSNDLHSPVAIGFLLATGGLSIVCGLLRGVSIRLSERDGFAFVRYTGVTVALWVATLAIKFGANFLFTTVNAHDAAVAGSSLFLTLGAGMLVEGIVVLARALRMDGRIIWAKGKDGAPHTMSPFLDGLQHNRMQHNRMQTNATGRLR